MQLLRRFPSCLLVLAFALPGSARAAADYATPYAFSTLAGTSSIGSQDATGADARFYSPRSVAVDAAGNAYVVDTGNHVIRKITPAGVVTTLAGKAGEPGSTDGTGAAARFDSPQSIVADATGNFYVTDTGNHTIRKLTTAGVVTTFAGLAGVPGNTDGPVASARFNEPLGLAIDATGNLYVSESGNQAIRKITAAGVASTLATGLGIREPYYNALAVDGTGTVYASLYMFRDYQNYYINGVLQAGEITRDIGFLTRLNSSAGVNSYLLQTTSMIWPPELMTDPSQITGLLPDGSGNLIVSGFKKLFRFNPTTGDSTTIAGSGELGSLDGAAGTARFSTLIASAMDPTGGYVVADAGNNVVRKVAANGTVSTLAGLALERASGTLDGAGAAARFSAPAGMVVDASGNLYVADQSAHCIRKVSPAGVVTTLAGNPGQSGSADGMGTAARFNFPTALALGPTGYLYVADSLNDTIRRVSLAGEVTTVAGTPRSPSGPFPAPFYNPRGVAVGATGIIYVADTYNHCIRSIAPDGTVSVFAGQSGASGSADGTGTSARFSAPMAITIGPAGDLYVAEISTSPSIARIRKVTPAGVVTTFAGAEAGYTDGSGTSARFGEIAALTAGSDGNLYVADSFNQVIRKVTPAGAVTTVAGLFEAAGNADGAGREARFFNPQGIALDAAGNLYVSSGTTIRKGLLASVPVISTQPASQSVQAGSSVTFSVSAAALPSPTYQWYKNGTAINGATSASLSLSNAQAGDAGDYTVIVANSLGSVTSGKATLTVTAAPVVTPPTPPPSSGGGGGGAPSDLFLLVLALLGAARLLRRK